MFEGCQIPKAISVDKIHTFFRSDFKKDYVFSGESHDFWEFVFVMDGTVGITADSDIYVLEKGQAVIHKPNEFHKIWSEFDTNPTVIVLSVTASVFPETDGRIVNLDSSQSKKVEELFQMSHECFERDSTKIDAPLPGKVFELGYFKLQTELLLLSLVQKQTRTVSSGIKSAEIYSSAVRLMEDHPDAGFCIDDISRMCSISPAYLKKIFVKYSGGGVMQYYNRLRARIACGHLENGRSVKETALLLGFADQNYFSTFFKRIMGVSPGKYRNQQ